MKLDQKSHFAAVLLAILFGPIGVLYGSILGGIILGVIAIAIGMAFFPLVIFVWFVGIFVAYSGVSSHNRQVKVQWELLRKQGVDPVAMGMAKAPPKSKEEQKRERDAMLASFGGRPPEK